MIESCNYPADSCSFPKLIHPNIYELVCVKPPIVRVKNEFLNFEKCEEFIS
jgi:hypothetical protein